MSEHIKHQHHHEHEHEHTHEHNHVHQPVHEELACDGEGHQHHHHDDGSCCCEHHAKEFHGIDRYILVRLIAAIVCLIAGAILPFGDKFAVIMTALATLIAGYDIFLDAITNLFRGKIFDEYFLMTLAAVAAFIIGEFEEGAAVILLYRVGSFFQSYAIRYSRKTIYHLMDDAAEELEDVGRVARITNFAKFYTPVVLVAAVLIAIILPIISDTTIKDAVYRALSFLVLACPCAIVISVPLAYSAGIGSAARHGIFFRNSEDVDSLAKGNISNLKLQQHVHDDSKVYRLESTEGMLVLKGDSSLGSAWKLARRTHVVAAENIWITILVKLAVLVLAILGVSSLWFAVFADSGITILTVLNSLRAFQIRKIEE